MKFISCPEKALKSHLLSICHLYHANTFLNHLKSNSGRHFKIILSLKNSTSSLSSCPVSPQIIFHVQLEFSWHFDLFLLCKRVIQVLNLFLCFWKYTHISVATLLRVPIIWKACLMYLRKNCLGNNKQWCVITIFDLLFSTSFPYIRSVN